MAGRQSGVPRGCWKGETSTAALGGSISFKVGDSSRSGTWSSHPGTAAPSIKCHHPAGVCPALGTPKAVPLPEGPQKGGVGTMGTPKGAQLPYLTRGQQNAAVPRAGDTGPPVPAAGSHSHILFGGPQNLPPQDMEAALPHHSAEQGAANSWLCLPTSCRGCLGEASSRAAACLRGAGT